jgi:hypothetical protein
MWMASCKKKNQLRQKSRQQRKKVPKKRNIVTPPSVKNAVVEKKPTTQAPVGQKNGQKQGKKPATKAPNATVKNTNVHPKAATVPVIGQQTGDKSNATPASQNSTPSVENGSKTSVSSTTTMSTPEALLKASEASVPEGSVPSGKTEKVTPEQTSVRPAVQKNVGKTPEVAVVKEDAPSVKSKNAVPYNEINQPANQEANQAAKQATTQAGAKKPVDKKAERPQAYMPAKQPQKAVDSKKDATKTAAAPIIEPQEEGPRNVLKSNLLYPFSLGFEHGLGKHFSIFVNGFFMPVVGFHSTTNEIRDVSLLKPSVGFAAEARYYISKTKAPLNGIYWGGFFTSRTADISLHVVSQTSTTSTDATITIPLGMDMYGLVIGKQKIRAKGFTTDFNFGFGSYTLNGIPNISSDAQGVFGRIGQFSKYRSGFGPRLSVNLGYAF